MIVTDKVHAHLIRPDGNDRQARAATARQEMRTHDDHCRGRRPRRVSIATTSTKAISVLDQQPEQHFETGYGYYGWGSAGASTELADGSVFTGQQAVRPGDKQIPAPQELRPRPRTLLAVDLGTIADYARTCKLREVDPQTGKTVRDSVPAWFEDADGGRVEPGSSELLPVPRGAEDSPLRRERRSDRLESDDREQALSARGSMDAGGISR